MVTAGLAEIAAGSIAMGLGGYLAAKTDVEHYESERQREIRETVELADVETEEVAKVFREYGLTQTQMEPVVTAICSDQKRWVDFMMRFELGLEAPDPKRATRSAITIAAAYIFGGLIPLAPYMLLTDIADGLRYSIADYARCPGGVWLCEEPLHRHFRVEGRPADGLDRRNRRHGGVPPGPPDRLVKLTETCSAGLQVGTVA